MSKKKVEPVIEPVIKWLKDKDQIASTKLAGKITGCVPAGSCVLVELLTPQEIQGTKLYMPEVGKNKDCPQAYVIALGPKVPTDLGFKVGDRVMVTGSYQEVPQFQEGARKLNLIEPHMIQGY